MKLSMLNRFKLVFVMVGWSTSIAAITLFMIFNGQLLPRGLGGFIVAPSPFLLAAFYLGSFAICVLASLVIEDISKGIISFFVAYFGAALLTALVLALPNLLGIFPYSDSLQHAAVIFTFDAFFPIPLLVNFAGVITGLYLAERLY
jgi:hypothetical protein